MGTGMININLDERCKQCGKKGAVNGNICLKCINKNIKNGVYDKELKAIRKKHGFGGKDNTE